MKASYRVVEKARGDEALRFHLFDPR